MRYLINGVEFTKERFEANVIESIGWNVDFKEVMSELVTGESLEISGDTYSII